MSWPRRLIPMTEQPGIRAYRIGLTRERAYAAYLQPVSVDHFPLRHVRNYIESRPYWADGGISHTYRRFRAVANCT